MRCDGMRRNAEVGFWSCVALENSSIQFADPSQHVEAPHHFDTLTTLKPSLGIALGDNVYTPNAGHPSGDPCNATGCEPNFRATHIILTQ